MSANRPSIWTLARKGLPVAEIARLARMSEGQVASLMERAPEPKSYTPYQRRKLAPEKVREALTLYARGELSTAEIGEHVGCSQSHVCELAARYGLPLRSRRDR